LLEKYFGLSDNRPRLLCPYLEDALTILVANASGNRPEPTGLRGRPNLFPHATGNTRRDLHIDRHLHKLIRCRANEGAYRVPSRKIAGAFQRVCSDGDVQLERHKASRVWLGAIGMTRLRLEILGKINIVRGASNALRDFIDADEDNGSSRLAAAPNLR